jgi:hypothetical protein
MIYLTNTINIHSHERITLEEFRITKTLYFSRLKKMDYHGRSLSFRNTYHSEDNVTWFKYNNYLYFSLATKPGSIQEKYYYGKQIINN